MVSALAVLENERDASIRRADNASIGEARDRAHLAHCDAHFVPPLSGRVDIDAYAAKIADQAERFEAWAGGRSSGLVAAYCNDPDRAMPHSSPASACCPSWRAGHRGAAAEALHPSRAALGMTLIRLEVAAGQRSRHPACTRSCGFSAEPGAGPR